MGLLYPHPFSAQLVSGAGPLVRLSESRRHDELSERLLPALLWVGT